METGTPPHLLIIEDDVLLNDMKQNAFCTNMVTA